ncbi:MAG: hypothetical protein BJ554DRAFT_6210 [Olpidium bornovanus]|uniref:DNA/RNA-binding protein Alba-like domain-containing protein n=1 Tax=Olpidium bornovanus TaxID=278681 RepID=A0A8H7ZYA1_9FUNG|nr:MAG: hypothetical protein BJ554DRAFT_6210 [Olpidium bornovanus]
MENFEHRPAAAGGATTAGAGAKRRAKRAAKAARKAEQKRRAPEARGEEDGPSAGAEEGSADQLDEEKEAALEEGAAEEGAGAKGHVPPNVVRVRASSKIRILVSRALAVLEVGEKPKKETTVGVSPNGRRSTAFSRQEGNSPCVQIIGAGKAITKAVSIVEIVKRRNNGTLHQYTAIGTEDEVDEWVPKERELDTRAGRLPLLPTGVRLAPPQSCLQFQPTESNHVRQGLRPCCAAEGQNQRRQRSHQGTQASCCRERKGAFREGEDGKGRAAQGDEEAVFPVQSPAAREAGLSELSRYVYWIAPAGGLYIYDCGLATFRPTSHAEASSWLYFPGAGGKGVNTAKNENCQLRRCWNFFRPRMGRKRLLQIQAPFNADWILLMPSTRAAAEGPAGRAGFPTGGCAAVSAEGTLTSGTYCRLSS